MSTSLPTSLSPTTFTKELLSLILKPSNSIITSPDLIPAFLAGPSGTSVTRAPLIFYNPSAYATSEFRF